MTFRKPTADAIRDFRAAQALLSFTYTGVGTTATAPPPGYTVDRTRAKLGEGEGAFLDHKKIQVSSVERLGSSLLSTGFPSIKRAQNPNIHYYWDFTLRSHGVRRDGSAALDLAGVACGRFDGFWEFGLKPWDTAAGVLLVREAGGTATDFAGRPYHPGGPELLASNRRIHAEMQRVAADIAERSAQRTL